MKNSHIKPDLQCTNDKCGWTGTHTQAGALLDEDYCDTTECHICGSELVGYEPITLGAKFQQVAVNLLGGAAVAVVAYVLLLAIFAIDAAVGGVK